MRMFFRRVLTVSILLGLSLGSAPAFAERIIYGYIKDADLNRVKGLRVVAYDHDGLPYGADRYNDYTAEDRHDWMGEDITSSSGYYRIEYHPPKRFASGDGHWDNFDHNLPHWRPDIYIKVYAPNDTFCKTAALSWSNYAWRYVEQSGVAMNQRTDTNKRIDLNLAEYFDTSCGTFSPLGGFMQGDQPEQIRGLVDMHAHPMAHLGFGAKVIHGAPDAGSLMLPGQSTCAGYSVRPPGIQQALSNCGPSHYLEDLSNHCGDAQRMLVVNVMEAAQNAQSAHGDGFPNFDGWPAHNDITHQQMWIDWIYRAYRGGLRVMVALAVNNETLGMLARGTGDLDDKTVGDRQIEEIKRMADRHHFMEIAYSSYELLQIVRRGNLAIVLGVELDDMGNLGEDTYVSPSEIRGEIQRLHGLGVRYAFPVHLTDNRFAGTAVYNDVFAISNYIQTGNWWQLDEECATTDYRFGLFDSFEVFLDFLGLSDEVQPTPSCSGGHVNNKALTWRGEVALREMMRLGMMIDIDHMSKKAAEETLELAETYAYPINSGHNGLVDYSPGVSSEYNRTASQYERISALGGMAGVGWSDGNADGFLNLLQAVSDEMGGTNVALGTDANGMSTAPSIYPFYTVDYNKVPIARTGTRKWNYNHEGVAHYGLMADFMVHLKNLTEQRANQELLDQLYYGADNFAKMWHRSEQSGLQLPNGSDCSTDDDCISDHCVDAKCWAILFDTPEVVDLVETTSSSGINVQLYWTMPYFEESWPIRGYRIYGKSASSGLWVLLRDMEINTYMLEPRRASWQLPPDGCPYEGYAVRAYTDEQMSFFSNTAVTTCSTDTCFQAPLGTPCERDENLCTLDQCNGSGACVSVEQVQCPTGGRYTCLPAVCEPTTGHCVMGDPAPAYTSCERDGSSCTVDACDGYGECVLIEDNCGVQTVPYDLDLKEERFYTELSWTTDYEDKEDVVGYKIYGKSSVTRLWNLIKTVPIQDPQSQARRRTSWQPYQDCRYQGFAVAAYSQNNEGDKSPIAYAGCYGLGRW